MSVTHLTSEEHRSAFGAGPGLPSLGAFGDWLAGFIDGEGCFQIDGPTQQGQSPRQQRFSYRCRFSISVRADDEPILQEIRRRTGIGTIRRFDPSNPNANPQARWEFGSKRECTILIAILYNHPLRAKKAADLAVWERAVGAWWHVGRNRENDYAELATCKAELDSLRGYTP